jgi:hypothetical protein
MDHKLGGYELFCFSIKCVLSTVLKVLVDLISRICEGSSSSSSSSSSLFSKFKGAKHVK